MEVTTVFSLLGGLGLFLFGIKTMGDGLEQAAGSKMKRLLEALTRNKFTAVLVGLLVTAVIQSSSATTVMVVGFVNAGLLSLSKAIGVIMGANIGTTVTSLMLSVKLNFGILFTAVGAICQLAGNRSSFKLLGQIMMGLGILFVGMDAMTEAMEPLRDWQGFRDMMELAKNPLVGVLVGAGVTALLQSSSASVGANRTAKRAAVVHLLFNVIGAALFIVLALVLPLASWIETLAGANLRLQIAFAHIIFNVVTMLLLLPISGLLEKLAYLVVRGEDKQQEPMRLEYFDARLFSTPPVAVQQLFREVQRMADIVAVNYRFAMQYYFAPKDLAVDEFDNREQVIDYLNAEITQNLIELKGLNLRADDIRLVGSLFHVVNDLERIGDHSMNIVEIGSARKKEKLRFSGKAEREIEELSGIVTSMLDKSIHIVKRQITDVEIIGEVIELESQVDKLCESLADHHVDRVKNKKCTPRNGMLYLDMLNNLERIADHADNLASSVESDHRENRLLW